MNRGIKFTGWSVYYARGLWMWIVAYRGRVVAQFHSERLATEYANWRYEKAAKKRDKVIGPWDDGA